MRRGSVQMTVKDRGVVYRLVTGMTYQQIAAEARRLKKRFRRVDVYNRFLKGKRDLHGKPYEPNTFYYIEE